MVEITAVSPSPLLPDLQDAVSAVGSGTTCVGDEGDGPVIGSTAPAPAASAQSGEPVFGQASFNGHGSPPLLPVPDVVHCRPPDASPPAGQPRSTVASGVFRDANGHMVWESDVSALDVEAAMQSPDEACLAACSIYWTAFCVSASADIFAANMAFELKRERMIRVICHSIKQRNCFIRRVALHSINTAQLRRLPLDAVKGLPQRLLRYWAAAVQPTDCSAVKFLAHHVLRIWDEEQSSLAHMLNCEILQSVFSGDDEGFNSEPATADTAAAHCRPPDVGFSVEQDTGVAPEADSGGNQFKAPDPIVVHCRPPDADPQTMYPLLQWPAGATVPDLCPGFTAASPRGTYPLLQWPVFSYVEAFAGSSAFSERAIPLGGSAIGFVEWEVSDHPLLSALEPSAWICGDLYDREWEQHSGPVDALLTWPMCKHLASCGLLRMQHDDVASQLWDTIDMAVHFEVRMVCTENVTRLEWDNQAHSLLDIDLQKWAAAGFSLAAVWFLRDCDLGGATWRERVWIIKECSRLTSRLPPLYQPVMNAVPQHMRTLVLPVQQVEHLSVFGSTDVVPSGWSPGKFRFAWTTPLQAGTVVAVMGYSGTFCVYTDRGDSVYVRSTDLRSPRFHTVGRDLLRETLIYTTIRSLDSPCHTLRSSPDPPGNCLLWDDRFEPPVPRMLHDDEVWLFQGGCPEQLLILKHTQPKRVVHTAGKRVTGHMSQLMAETVQSRTAMLNAAALGGMSLLAEPLKSFVLFVPYCLAEDTAFVACKGSLFMGEYVARGRDSVISLAARFMHSTFNCSSPSLLAGETQVGGEWRWIVACPVESHLSLTAPLQLQSHFGWQSASELEGCPVWSALASVKLRLHEFFRPSYVIWRSDYALGKSIVPAVINGCVKSVLSWQQQCSRAAAATVLLQLKLEGAAGDAQSLGDLGLSAFLLSWHHKVQPFHEQSVPEQLRQQIPSLVGFSRCKFPSPHKPPTTAWLPLKENQPKLFKRVSGFRDFFSKPAWKKICCFLKAQELWLDGKGPRPALCAINESDWVDWARGLVLDLRRLSEGIVTELDYSASTPTQFNTAAILERLKHYDDQEAVSFFVLGVRFKAELAHQLVFNHHLLNLEGHHEEIYADIAKLAEDPYGWIGLFAHCPFLPCRFNGKGQVAKGIKMRPVEESGGPRKRSTDSAGIQVFSLNSYVDGTDKLEGLEGSDLELQLAENSKKWPHENKPTVAQLRKANCIINEGADLCELDTYVIRTDWLKYFNQWMLAPEEYPKCCNSFPGNRYVVNYCLTFGISMASNIAQRGANAFVLVFLEEFAKLDAPFLQQEAEHHPKFAEWLKIRENLGPLQAALMWMFCFTDDPIWVVAGADRVVRVLKLWRCVSHLFGLLPAHPDKHAIGLNVEWLGIIHHIFFGLTEVPERKALKAIVGLTAATNSEMLAADGLSLLGLMEHIRHALGIKGVMRLYALWRCVNLCQPGELFFLLGAALKLAQDWLSLLLSCRGSAVASVVSGVPPPAAAWSWSVTSDAALEPPEEAGMGGFIAGWHWRVPVSDGLHGLTIPVLELLAAGLNLIVLYVLLGSPSSGAPQFWIKWEVDALAAHFVLKNDSASSEMMVFVHHLIISSDAFKYFEPALLLCHTYGPANPSDAASRGNLQELHSLSSCLNYTLRELQLPPAAQQMIDAVVGASEGASTNQSWSVPGFCRQTPPAPLPLLPVRASMKRVALVLPGGCPPARRRLAPVRGRVACDALQPAHLTSDEFKPPHQPSSRPQVPPVLVPVRASLVVQAQCPTHLHQLPAAPQPTHPSGQQAALVPTRASLVEQTARTSPALLRSEALTLALHKDESKYALAPGNPAVLAHLCLTAHDVLSKSYSLRTCKRDAACFAKWSAYCRTLDTSPWRDDAAANSGADPIGFQRENVLLINFLIHTQQVIQCRPAGSNRTAAKPDSAMAHIFAVRRVFKANMIPLISLVTVTRALQSISRSYLKQFGQHALTPRRAAPFTNELLDALLGSHGTLAVSSQKSVEWSSFEGLNLKAALALARSSGMRKSELVGNEGSHSLCFSNIRFLLRGVLVARPTLQQLNSLVPGDFLVIMPPPSKSDQFGIVWGSLPIYIHYQDKPGNAVRLVAQLFIQRPDAAPSSPLLCAAPGRPFTHHFMDRALAAWLLSTGMTTAQAALYSWHSARAYLASALIAANRDPHVVQALLRWQSVDSIRVYACLNPAAYASHLQAAESATVAGIRGAHAPLIDSMDLAFSMQQHVVPPTA